MWRFLGLWPLATTLLVLAAIACGSPSAPPTKPIFEIQQDSPAATSLDESPPAPSSGIRHLTEEELRAVLKRVSFSFREWPYTNLRIHSVPLTEFSGGGPARDDIPSIDLPQFEPVNQADKWLVDREPVQVANVNGDVRAYPLQILIWHEIGNDVVGGELVTITY